MISISHVGCIDITTVDDDVGSLDGITPFATCHSKTACAFALPIDGKRMVTTKLDALARIYCVDSHLRPIAEDDVEVAFGTAQTVCVGEVYAVGIGVLNDIPSRSERGLVAIERKSHDGLFFVVRVYIADDDVLFGGNTA